MKKTPLYHNHVALGGKMIAFGEWTLPVQYTSIIAEHEAVRKDAGIFDVSHMGEIYVTGPSATAYLQKMLTNDVERLADNDIQYSFMCYENGGVVDDLLVYKFTEEKYLLVVNASNIEKDYQWLLQHQIPHVAISNVSDDHAQIAIQGPKAREIVASLNGEADTLLSLKRFTFMAKYHLNGVEVLISRTGYTGEDGFEIYLQVDDAPHLWQYLLQAGEPLGLKPAGLGARDSLRFEAGLPLYGHELSADITPLEAGLKYFVRLKGRHFIGADALKKQKKAGIPRKLIGVEMVERGIPRAGYAVHSSEGMIGIVTSGGYSPTLKKAIAHVLVNDQDAKIGHQLYIDINGKQRLGRTVKIPFYKNI